MKHQGVLFGLNGLAKVCSRNSFYHLLYRKKLNWYAYPCSNG